MDIVENTLDTPLETFLEQPLFCFLATASPAGPRVSPLWFLWEDEEVWIIAERRRTYPDRIEQFPETALAVVDFDRRTGRVHHVGMRGTASVEPHDPERAERLLSTYLGPEKSEWDQSRFGDPQTWGEEMCMIQFVPETVVARDQSYDAPDSLS